MKEPCPKCNGVGWTSEHDPTDTSEQHYAGYCTSCPIQVQCEYCEATGEIEVK